jgi:Helix-turn-helix domain
MDRSNVTKPEVVSAAIFAKSAVEREYASVAEAEQLTGISRWTWRQMAYSGRVASSKVGRRLLIPISEIRRVLSEGMRPRIEA